MTDRTIHRRDFYWKRVGWRWEVWTEQAGHHYSLGLRFWRESTAALVTNVIFGTWHDGRDIEREARLEIVKAEHCLSDAYLRLRAMIPGAFDTPHAPEPEQIWEITERALATALTTGQRP